MKRLVYFLYMTVWNNSIKYSTAYNSTLETTTTNEEVAGAVAIGLLLTLTRNKSKTVSTARDDRAANYIPASKFATAWTVS